MAAGIAHELKNPLAGIEVMAGLLRRQVPDSKDAQSLLADILSEAKLANAIVVEMLEFVRPVRLQVERTDLADVLQQAVTMAESKAPRGDVAVTINVGAGPADDRRRSSSAVAGVHEPARQRVRGARRQRRASRFTAVDGGDRGRPGVCRHPSADAGRCMVDVADDGPGMPAELTDRIFNPFFTTKVTGTGLGLAIVRKIVDAHDGRIDVEQRAGDGHALPGHAAGRAQSAVEWFESWTGCKSARIANEDCMGRILVADDHDALRRGLVRGLTEAGHEVEEASNGNAAIERLHDSYFDVVLSDLKMGGSDGMDVLRTTRGAASDDGGDPDDGVRIGEHRGRGDEDRRLRLRAEAVRDRGDGGQDREGARSEAPEATSSTTSAARQQDIYEFDKIVGSSAALQHVLDIVKKVAKSNTTVLIRGETGTGKELIAGAIAPQLAAQRRATSSR